MQDRKISYTFFPVIYPLVCISVITVDNVGKSHHAPQDTSKYRARFFVFLGLWYKFNDVIGNNNRHEER